MDYTPCPSFLRPERPISRPRYATATRAPPGRANPHCAVPTSYDPKLLEALPAEVIERDYGCGDPSRHLRHGETVLDLGSGTGKICFLASQIVGPTGRVIGVDMNDDMLDLARRAAPEVAAQHRVLERRVPEGQDPGSGARSGHRRCVASRASGAFRSGPRRARGVARRELRRDAPADRGRLDRRHRLQLRPQPRHAPGQGDDVPRAPPRPPARRARRDLRHRQRRGCPRRTCSAIPSCGRAASRVRSARICSWRRSSRRASTASRCSSARSSRGEPSTGSSSAASPSPRTRARKAPCLDQNHAVIYRGPWRQVEDDDGHVLRRGVRTAVCEKTFRHLRARARTASTSISSSRAYSYRSKRRRRFRAAGRRCDGTRARRRARTTRSRPRRHRYASRGVAADAGRPSPTADRAASGPELRRRRSPSDGLELRRARDDDAAGQRRQAVQPGVPPLSRRGRARSARRSCRATSPSAWSSCSRREPAVDDARHHRRRARAEPAASAGSSTRRARLGRHVIDRCNLTVLFEPGMEDLARVPRRARCRGHREPALLQRAQRRRAARPRRVRQEHRGAAAAQRARLRQPAARRAEPRLQPERRVPAAGAGDARGAATRTSSRSTSASRSTTSSRSRTCRSRATRTTSTRSGKYDAYMSLLVTHFNPRPSPG